MSIVPESRLGKIEFYEAHLAPWTANATQIGLTPMQVTGLSAKVTKARGDYLAHLAAQDAARAATQLFYESVRQMHNAPAAGADMIAEIKNFAQTTNNPNVYVLAQIPPPAAAGTVPPPGTPFNFTVGLLQSGAVELKWKCSNPSGAAGTIYEVKRGSGGGGLEYVGSSGVRSFTDETIPAGSSPVTYQITAVRSTARGNPAQFTVTFGIGGGGLTIMSTNEESGGPVRMAA